MLLINSIFPDFSADTSEKSIRFHEWLGDSWGIMFSHPFDFTPVCTTELGEISKRIDDFAKRNVKIIGLSIGSVNDHKNWATDICSFVGTSELGFPIISPSVELVEKLGLKEVGEADGSPIFTCRGVFFISPDKRLKASIFYPATTGRNVDEILRVIDSLQLTTEKPFLATPVNWTVGSKCMVQPKLTDEEALNLIGTNFTKVKVPSNKSYMRFA